MSELNLELKSAMTELKSAIANACPKSTVEKLQKQVDALDVKLADKTGYDSGGTALIDQLRSNDDVNRLLRDKKGSIFLNFDAKTTREILQTKTVLTSTGQGFQTTGVLPLDRIPGITPEPRQTLSVRDILSAAPTSMAAVDFIRVSTPLGIASPVAEASVKPENALTFTSSSEKVRTIATWLPATRQILDDIVELNGFLLSSLPYYVNLEEELQLLSGDGTGENLHGLITQATAFSTSLLSAASGWNKIDIVGRAIQQITAAKELDPTFIVMHPNDWFGMRLTKDSYGRYILGDPQTNVTPMLFGLTVVYTTSIASGTFLIGSGSPIASQIRDRMEMQVEISTSHSDFFVRNQVAIRAEKRLCLVVKRPASYITGTFSQSPA